jgi:hypothetical protein
VLNLQPWHINNEDALVFQEGTGPLDLARGYYDSDRLEVVISLEAKQSSKQSIAHWVHRSVLMRLWQAWPTADIRREDEGSLNLPTSPVSDASEGASSCAPRSG